MRPQKVDDLQILTGCMSVFRTKGNDGVSLKELADATGWQKPSLYHRYPESIGYRPGRAKFCRSMYNYETSEVISNKGRCHEARITQVSANISPLYESGKNICILRSLSVSNNLDLFGQELKMAMNR